MKKILYFTYDIDLSEKTNGIVKKIYSQVEGLKANNTEVILSGNYNNYYMIDEEKIYQLTGNKIIDQKNIIKKITELTKKNSFDCVYVRKIKFLPHFIKVYIDFFKIFNKVIMEVPTYPYLGEIKKNINKIYYGLEILLIKYILSKYINRIITFSSHDYIFNIKTINISNGVSVKNIYLNNKICRKNELNIVSVSSMDFWHGIDRGIKSLAKYQGEVKIKLNLIGGDEEKIKMLKGEVTKYNLENSVVFYGRLEGKSLEEIYIKSDIGMGSLARHRSKIYQLSSLKNREYLAYGLPIFYSENDIDIDDKEFAYKIPPDESVIDFYAIAEWYNNLNVETGDILNFSKNFSWSYQMKKVYDFVQE